MPATSFAMNAIGACDAIRAEATDMAGQNAPFNLGRATGALDFITDPQNDVQQPAQLAPSRPTAPRRST